MRMSLCTKWPWLRPPLTCDADDRSLSRVQNISGCRFGTFDTLVLGQIPGQGVSREGWGAQLASTLLWCRPLPETWTRSHRHCLQQGYNRLRLFGIHVFLYVCWKGLDSTLHHHHQNIRGNMYWKNDVHLSSTFPETCTVESMPRHTQAVLPALCGLLWADSAKPSWKTQETLIKQL